MQTESALRAAVSVEALRWLGVLYGHQQRNFGVNGDLASAVVDCIGLVACVGRNAGVMGWVEDDPRWGRFRSYGREAEPKLMQEGLEMFLHRIPREDYQVGDVIWVRDRNEPRHLGIVVCSRSIVHADLRRGQVERYPIVDVPPNFFKAAFRYERIQQAIGETG